MKRLLFIFLFISVLLYANEIKIAAAANISYAIEDLKKAFYQTNPQTNVHVILGSSGKLFAQITHGAPFDLFLSANMIYPDRLYTMKIAITKPVVYAQGALAIVSKKKRDFCAEIFVLKDRDIATIAIGNPKTAPYGVAAKEALQKAKIYDQIKEKLVYAESISQTLAYISRAADIGIVAKSALYAPQMSAYKEAIHWMEVNERLYTPINQGMVILKHAQENKEARAFYDFMRSEKAKRILKKYGYRI